MNPRAIIVAWDTPDPFASMAHPPEPNGWTYKDIQWTDPQTLSDLCVAAGSENFRTLAYTVRKGRARGQFFFSPAGIANIEALRGGIQ